MERLSLSFVSLDLTFFTDFFISFNVIYDMLKLRFGLHAKAKYGLKFQPSFQDRVEIRVGLKFQLALAYNQ